MIVIPKKLLKNCDIWTVVAWGNQLGLNTMQLKERTMLSVKQALL